METLWSCIKRWAFLEGLVVGLLLCHYFYSEFRIDEIKESFDAKEQALNLTVLRREDESKTLSDKLAKSEQYEQKYIVEASRSLSLDRKLSELQIDMDALSRRHADLQAMKWEEKYNAEKLSRLSGEEENALLRQRLKGAESNQPTADPHLLHELEALTESNRILQKERDELRKLYVSATQLQPQTEPKSRPHTVSKSTPFPVGALDGVSTFDVGETIISIVASSKKPVDNDTFIVALSKASAFDRGYVVKACAPALTYPLSTEQIKSISQLVAAFESGGTMQVLLKEQAKH
jgi:hypothetical protein